MALHWRKRSDAVVFVDDYVTGALPPLCVLSGTPANATITFRSSVNATSPAAWLLVLLGPLGWVVLAYLVLRSDRRRLVGELPIVRTQWEHLRSVKHAGWALAGVHPDFARSVARTRTAQRDDSSRVT